MTLQSVNSTNEIIPQKFIFFTTEIGKKQLILWCGKELDENRILRVNYQYGYINKAFWGVSFQGSNPG